MATTPTLPPAGARGPSDHRAISLRFLDHAQIELDKGNRLQAGEKAWGAVAHQLKAIARARGWNSEGHANLYAVADYLAREYGTAEGVDPLPVRVGAIDLFHQNFYENVHRDRALQGAIGSARRLVNDLEEIRQKEPQTFTIENKDDQGTVTMLTGVEYPLEETRGKGFVNIPTPTRPARVRRRRPRDPDDYRTGGSAARRRPPPTSGAPSAALPVPGSEHEGRVKPPTPERPTGQINPMTDIDTGATSFLDEPKPPKNETLMGIRTGGSPPAARPRASAPSQHTRSRQARRGGAHRLPSGRRDRRR